MTVEAFLDTNIVVYAASGVPEDEAKRLTARALIAKQKTGISVQVLQEFYAVTTRKRKPPLSHRDAMKWLTLLEELPCAEISRELVIEAAENSHNLGLSYWDGAIIAAAAQIGAFILYTEDLNHGQKYGSVTAINPFRTA